MTAEAQDVPTGNAYDKYGTTNPLFRRLVTAFRSDLDELLAVASPGSILDVGCGEGVLTAEWAERAPNARVVGVDLDDPELQAQWQARRRPNLEFRVAEGSALPFGTEEFDLVAGIELLEHVAHPRQTLEELTRVAERWLLISTPREPLWRVLNVLRGSYLWSLGNTPGHVNHWSRRGIAELAAQYGTIVTTRSPLPWTIVLARVR